MDQTKVIDDYVDLRSGDRCMRGITVSDDDRARQIRLTALAAKA
jgi:hypothetical protein